jgi:DNA-binding transcriptional LysR family regulator
MLLSAPRAGLEWTCPMNLRQIEVFRAVMLAGSVTDAARMLNVSQPGISRMLAHVELQLAVKLFERSKGKLKPTPEAQALHAEVEQVYRGVKRIDEVASNLKNGMRLTLRVLASPSTGLEVVPCAVSELASQFPSARIYMETLLAREMVSQLVNNDADVAISTLPITHALLESQSVGHWSLACVFPAGHRFAAQRSVSLREVMKERLIAFSGDTPQGRFIADWADAHQAAPQTQIEVRAGQVACELVACGAGVAIVDNLTAHALRGDKLGFRPVSRGPVFEVCAVRNANSPASAMARAFVQKVAANIKALRRE